MHVLVLLYCSEFETWNNVLAVLHECSDVDKLKTLMRLQHKEYYNTNV